MLAYVGLRINPNEELWSKSIFTDAPGAKATAKRMADEDVHCSKRPRKLLEIEHHVRDGPGLRRFAMSRVIHGIAIKTSGGERFAEAKEHFFRPGASMGEKRNGMRTRRCRKKSKRGCVCSQHYFFDANARLDRARKYGPKNQDDDGCCDYPTVGASIHDIWGSFPEPRGFGDLGRLMIVVHV